MINKIEIANFTVFEDCTIEFGRGINVFIGENGTGKTHLLKFLYGLFESANKSYSDLLHPAYERLKSFMDYFNPSTFMDIFRTTEGIRGTRILPPSAEVILHAKSLEHKIHALNLSTFGGNPGCVSELNGTHDYKSVFIPATEMLSHSKGFLQLYQEKEISYDKTHYNIVNDSQRVFDKGFSHIISSCMTRLSAMIDGEVSVEGTEFYMKKTDGKKILFSLEAEGLRKLGLLWVLMRNGSITENTVLFWDEPEANISPIHLPALAEILLELSRNGVQVFLATHSYNVAKLLEANKKEGDDLLFHSLYKTENGVKSKSARQYKDIPMNSIEMGENILYNAVIQSSIDNDEENETNDD